MVETGKHNLKFAETGKVFLLAVESRKSLSKKTTKSCGNRKIRKKAWKAGKGRYFLQKPGNGLPITLPSSCTILFVLVGRHSTDSKLYMHHALDKSVLQQEPHVKPARLFFIIFFFGEFGSGCPRSLETRQS